MIHIAARIVLGIWLAIWLYICWSMVGTTSNCTPDVVTTPLIAIKVFSLIACTAILGFLSANRKGDW